MNKLYEYEVVVLTLEIAYGLLCFVSTKDVNELIDVLVDSSELIFIMSSL
jgi:hypothetical protein